ncbi:NTPase-like protein [Streptomyces zinciresistens K42]|uniref:NTPase-like protein n=1 Tax=Streptomyces zinciresistens K42 TaxID=700597 RepID=G2GA62_9ACTN|nr:tetratricopeptide repeat protein [Streptomyces zinciresistens]EGX59654.1 NTPase-like protein [Streptomyces zinciresistens K42]
MLELISLATVTAMLGAVGAGMGNEAGRNAYLMIGGLARRIAGREVPAPERPAEWEGLARLLYEGALRSPEHARGLAEVDAVVGRALIQARIRTSPQLPEGVRGFVDRDKQMKRLTREASRKFDGRARRVHLYGPEGMGGTSLALRWGWRELQRYPDGQLYVDLARVPDPALALRQALSSLGLGPQDIPPGLGERMDLFRRLVADRRLLIVLDHVQSAAQAAPLLTSAPGVFTIVVAHRRLAQADAEPVEVVPLPEKYAVELLTEVAGKRTVQEARARAVLAQVLEQCGGSPYALRTFASLLEARLGEEGTATVSGNEPAHAAAQERYRTLGPTAARLYRLSALWPWPALSPAVAGAMAEVEEAEAARLLAEFAEEGLVEETGTGTGRYRFRPAVRRHAERAAAQEDGIPACSRAVTRAVEWLLAFAVRADRAALPERWHVGPLFAELPPGPYASKGEAVTALGTELGNLVQAVFAAEEYRLGDTACQLCEALWALQLKDGRHEEILPALRVGTRVADDVCPGTRMAGRMHTLHAMALIESRRFDEAGIQAEAAAAAERQAGHLRGLATAVETLGLVRLGQWGFPDAHDLFVESDGIWERIGPGDDGYRDKPRARALLKRHRGRALNGLHRPDEAEELLVAALGFFREREPYNTARTLTDLAETYRGAGRQAEALPLIDEAIDALAGENARYHVRHLRALRDRCVNEPGPAPG